MPLLTDLARDDAEKIGLVPNPIGGADLEKVVKHIFTTPKSLVDLARAAVE